MKLVPKRRFKGFADSWERFKIERIANSTYGGGTPTTSNEKYWNGTIPWIQSSDVAENIIFGIVPKKYISRDGLRNSATKLIPENSIAIVTRVGVGKLAIIPFAYSTSQDFLSLSNLKIDVWFSAYAIYQRLQGESNAVQGTSIKGITKEELLSKVIFVPNNEEQAKIGMFFRNIDELTLCYQHKLKKLQAIKQAYLHEMFPAEGESVPKRRFKGFTGEWREQKFGDVLKAHAFNLFLAKPLEYGPFKVIQQGDDPISGYADGNPYKDYKDVVLFGDHTLSLYKPESPFFLATDGIKILSGDNIDGFFLYTLIERYRPKSQGYKRHFTILKDLTCVITKNRKEQQKIGSFFRKLDERIALQQAKVEKLKAMKQAYLHEMFV